MTPNIPEAQVLSGLSIKCGEDMLAAAKEINGSCGCAVLLKGGHSVNDANDLLYADGEAVRRAKAYLSGALAAMLDLGRGSGPMNHAFGLRGEFAEDCRGIISET